jgi:hypothetical protein
MVIIPEPDFKFIEECLCEFYQRFWAQLKLAVDVIEDELSIGVLRKVSGNRGHG